MSEGEREGDGGGGESGKGWKRNGWGEMEGSGKNSRSAMHAELNRQRKICVRVCARAWLSERPRCS